MGEAAVAAPPSVLVKLASAFVEAGKRVEEAETALKKLKIFREMAEKKLADQMQTEEMKSFRTEQFGGFNVQVAVYPGVKDKEALGKWVKSKKLTWLYTTQVHGGKLKAFVRELLEKGKPLPPGVDAYMAPVIRRFK